MIELDLPAILNSWSNLMVFAHVGYMSVPGLNISYISLHITKKVCKVLYYRYINHGKYMSVPGLNKRYIYISWIMNNEVY